MADNDERAPHYMNGEVLAALPPPRPRLYEPGQLGPDAGFPELARAWATVGYQVVEHARATNAELDEHRGGINHLGRVQHAHGETLQAHGQKLDDIHTLVSAMVTPSGRMLPPMHDRRESNLDMIEQVTNENLHKLRKRASETPGPGVGAPPEEVAAMMREAMEQFVAEREARDKARAEAVELAMLRTENEARLENEKRSAQEAALAGLKASVDAATTKDLRDKARGAIDEAVRRGTITGQNAIAANLHWEVAVRRWVAAEAKQKSDRRKLALQIAVPLLVSFLGWVAAQAYAEAKAKAEGDRRFVEGQQSSGAVVVVAPPLPMLSASSLPAPAAPAAVAPAAPRHP